MTDPRSTLSDEDLAAVLDGTAELSVLDRLARDPAARARRDQLAAAAGAVAAPVTPLAPAAVDELLARALAAGPAFEAGPPLQAVPAPHDPSAPPADVSLLQAPPAPSRRTPPSWLVAAVVAGLVAIGLGLVWSGRQSDQDQTTASRSVDQTALEDAADGGADEDAGSGAATSDGEVEGEAAPGDHSVADEAPPERPSSTDDIGPAGYLGSFDSPEDLRAALAEAFLPATDPPSSVEVPRDVSVDRCAEQMQITLSLPDPTTAQGYALVDGQVLLVYEFEGVALNEGDDPTSLVTAVDVIACDPAFTFRR